MKHHKEHGMYKHEEDHPHVPKKAHFPSIKGENCEDFKKQSADQAYGQAGKHGVDKDMKKIHSQFLHVYDDSNSGY